MNLEILKQIPGVNKDFKIKTISHPTKIIVIDDFFINPFYYYLNSRVIYNLRENTKKGQPVNQKDIQCILNIDTISENKEKDFSNFFISKIWHKSIGNALGLEINQYTSIFTNYLKPNSNRGIYSGATLCSVFDEEEVVNNDSPIMVGQDESYNIDYEEKKLNKIIKNASAIYFCHAPENEEGSSLEFYEGDITKLSSTAKTCLKINAKANRLVLFEFNPDSLHRIINFKNHVGYIQQYFHSNPAYYFNKNLYKIYKIRFKNNLPLVDRQNNERAIWNIENDKQYSKYFSTLTIQDIFTNFHIRRLLIEKFNILSKQQEAEKEDTEDKIINPSKPLGIFKTKLPEQYSQILKDLFISNLNENSKFYTGKIKIEENIKNFILDKIDKYEKMLGHNFYYQKNDPDVVFQSKSAAYVHKKEITQHQKHLNVQKVTLWKHHEKKGPQRFTWTDIINAKIVCVIYLDVESEGSLMKFHNLYINPDKYNTKQHESGRVDNCGEWLFFSSPTEFMVHTNDIIIYPGAIVHEVPPIKADKERLIVAITFD